MQVRNISKEFVLLVIENPDRIVDNEKSVKIYQKVNEDYLYRVFINEQKEPHLIITVYRTSKILKYES
jgi:uncharacterized protein (DUF924 family)